MKGQSFRNAVTVIQTALIDSVTQEAIDWAIKSGRENKEREDA